jgi:hypothetical protein
MDTHLRKRKTDDTEQRKRKLLTFKEFLAVHDQVPSRKRASESATKHKVEEMCDS